MRLFNLYRIASILLIVFLLSHTLGGMLSGRSHGIAADTVLATMKGVRFDCMGSDCTYYGYYFGFGLLFSVFLLFSAWLAWFLGGLAPAELARLAPVTWAFFASHVLVAALGWAYFFIAPQIVSTLIAVLLGSACVRSARAR
jgi:hypothetical protein